MFKYLGAHPQVEASIRKEIRFFSEFYDRGSDWYRSHFPLAVGNLGRAAVYFEATPDYLLDPRAAHRATRLLPDVRIVALLRDPVERACSHYYHNRRLGTEPLSSFRDALAAEAERIGPALSMLQAHPDRRAPKALLRYSYVERGRYATQLQRWKDVVDRDRILVLKSEDLFQDPHATFQEILQFLGLKPWRPETYRNFSFTDARPVPPPIPDDCREWVTKALVEEVERLPEVLGTGAPFFEQRSRGETSAR